ncbi:MAG: hypothetical protein ACK56I_16830, partial [bacterium]
CDSVRHRRGSGTPRSAPLCACVLGRWRAHPRAHGPPCFTMPGDRMTTLFPHVRTLAAGAAALALAACASDPLTPALELERREGKLPKPARVHILKRTPPLKAVET